MRPAVIRIIDFGWSDPFEDYADFVRKLVGNHSYALSPDQGLPAVHLESLRVRDALTVAAALTRPALVVHISAHGSDAADEVGFYAEDDTELPLEGLANQLAELGHGGIVAAGIFADGCRTATARFITAMRHCLGDDVVYIGTRRSSGWDESTLFASLF